MLDNLFPFMDTPDDNLFDFIAHIEGLFENPYEFKDSVKAEYQGNPYELHLILQSLKQGDIDFKGFMDKATAWAQVVNHE